MEFLAHIVAPLNHVLFKFGADDVTWAELLGFITGIWCVWLTVKAKVLNFPVGLANAFFFLVLFLAAGLYADSALQIVFFILGVAGWWQWLHAGTAKIRPTTRATTKELALLVAFVIATTAALFWLLIIVHDIAPFFDALTTALSLAAQWLLNYKKIQNWWFWIVADLIYIPLYAYKTLWLTAIVYVAFLALCFLGLAAWKRDLAEAQATAGEAPEPAAFEPAEIVK